jgi:Domain of unknown function (DUF543)
MALLSLYAFLLVLRCFKSKAISNTSMVLLSGFWSNRVARNEFVNHFFTGGHLLCRTGFDIQRYTLDRTAVFVASVRIHTMSNASPDTSAAAAAAPSKSSGSDSSSSSSSSHWKLPDGIEDHLEDGVYKVLAGATAGGIVGLLLFKSGRGWRSASMATGVGMAVGSTLTRIYGGSSGTISSSSSSSSNPTTVAASTSATTTSAASAAVQKFHTQPPPQGPL